MVVEASRVRSGVIVACNSVSVAGPNGAPWAYIASRAQGPSSLSFAAIRAVFSFSFLLLFLFSFAPYPLKPAFELPGPGKKSDEIPQWFAIEPHMHVNQLCVYATNSHNSGAHTYIHRRIIMSSRSNTSSGSGIKVIIEATSRAAKRRANSRQRLERDSTNRNQASTKWNKYGTLSVRNIRTPVLYSFLG